MHGGRAHHVAVNWFRRGGETQDWRGIAPLEGGENRESVFVL